MYDLNTLNRLRVNAGKPELGSWKASKAKLAAAVEVLLNAGFLDTVPGANVEAVPVTDDPVIAQQLTPEERPTTKVKPQLARGLDTDGYAKHSRKAVQDIREKERRVAKAERHEAKKEAATLAKGEVDPKKDPEKAARQKQHIEDKKAARAAKNPTKSPVKERGDSEITVAEIAREVGFDPKVARAKLRRHEAKLEKLHTKGQDRWTFPKSAADELKKILKGEK